MNDARLNPLRLILAAILVGYFALLFSKPASPAPTPTPTANTPTGQTLPAALLGCHGRILEATAGAREVRLKVDGAAEVIKVAYDGGLLLKPTPQACSAGYCRVLTPAPPQSVGLDDCTPVTFP